MSEENGKQKKAQSPMEAELRAIRRVARAVEALDNEARIRVLQYVVQGEYAVQSNSYNKVPGIAMSGLAQSR